MSQVAKQCLGCRYAQSKIRITANCKNCGSEFQHKPNKPKLACSPECATTLRNIGTKETQCRKVEIKCEWCGAGRLLSPSNSHRRFCSRACGYLANTGSGSATWKGGVTSEHHAFYSSREWKLKCRDIWARHRGKCGRCNIRPERGEVHHIRTWAKYPDDRMRDSNLILLCYECHKWVHSKKNKQRDFLYTPDEC
ncbi:HNH endonuclease [Psychrobacter celer]|uniref:HNH endonuclease n=1 Tax=Psychrobacter celer TaxID=306572 RepID=UPI003FD01129